MEIKNKIYAILCLAILLPLSYAPAFAYTDTLSVLIDSRQEGGKIGGANITVTGADGVSDTFSGTADVFFQGPSAVINNKKYPMPVTIESPEALQWNSTKYRGAISLTSINSKYLVLNIVGSEDYLKGVLKAEMNPKWPIEALRAQAVIARTYAAKSEGKHSGYDLCSTTHCQAYKGISYETPQIDEAVSSTEGLILRWQNAPASVFYHSDCGGITASSLSVWGKQIPYLQAVAEPVPVSGPHSSWQSTLSASDIETRLASNGIGVGSISSISVSARDESGRVASLEIRGSISTQKMTGHKFRTVVGSDRIKSTLFSINDKPKPVNTPISTAPTITYDTYTPSVKIDKSKMPKDPQEQLVWLTKHKIFTTRELMDMLSKPDKINNYLEIGMARIDGRTPAVQPQQNTEVQTSPSHNIVPSGGITFYGMGWGHGVGMSQYGAKALAENGWDFVGILNHYFPGTVLGQ